MNNAALVLMARAPEEGKVKTRLQPALTPAQCTSLYKAFLGDALGGWPPSKFLGQFPTD